MIRRLVAAPVVILVGLLLSTASASPAGALRVRDVAPPAAVPTTHGESPDATDTLPGTTLEAEQRDDDTSPAPWLIGSGLAAAAVVAIGGTLLKRRAG